MREGILVNSGRGEEEGEGIWDKKFVRQVMTMPTSHAAGIGDNCQPTYEVHK